MERQETAILIASIILIVLIILIIFLFSIFQKRKNSLLLQQKEAEKKYEQEIAETQIEIREETLRNISWELHDNIGQLLTLAKIQVSVAHDDPNKLQEVTDTITKSLVELRSLSKLINPDAINSLSLTEALQLEIERFNRLQFIEASLVSNENQKTQVLDDKVEIIIFRILQEFFTNTIKHSKAHELEVEVNFQENQLVIHAKDNGVGFDMKNLTKKRGIGLGNIESRGKLINATIKLDSKVNQGTCIKLTYPFKKENIL